MQVSGFFSLGALRRYERGSGTPPVPETEAGVFYEIVHRVGRRAVWKAAVLIVLSSGEWLSCAVCSVSDICVRLCSLYQASGGPRKLNPISVFIQPVSLDVYTALRFAPSVSPCA